MIAFLAALIILVIGCISGYFAGGYLLSLCIGIALLVAIFLFAPILKPTRGHFKTRLLSLLIFGEIASTVVRGESWIVQILNLGVKQIGISPIQTAEPLHQILLLFISGTVLIILNWLFERRRILPPAPTGVIEEEEPFQQPETEKSLLQVHGGVA